MRHSDLQKGQTVPETYEPFSSELGGDNLRFEVVQAKEKSIGSVMGEESSRDLSLPRLSIVDGDSPYKAESASRESRRLMQTGSEDNPDARGWIPEGAILERTLDPRVREICDNPDAADWIPKGRCEN